MAVMMPTEAALRQAGDLIREGQLVAFPTETVYGLGADSGNGEAVAGIFAAKRRPHFNPLIVHVLDLTAAENLGEFTPVARDLAGKFWPGPLTIVVRQKPGAHIASLVTAGLDTVAIRVPQHPIARALLLAAQRPLAAPSANRSGKVSPTLARHVAADFGDTVSMVLDGGAATHGIESTVIDATADQLVLLRSGTISAETIERATGQIVKRSLHDDHRPNSPGQLASHYAPSATVRLRVDQPEPGEAVLAFGRSIDSTGMVINLSPSGNLTEAAANLFASLRAFDDAGAPSIAVMPIPNEGLGEAINDRLTRAAAPRP
jgi:L-threonylcarbamoyladenylate synthase